MRLSLRTLPPNAPTVEIVERKGLGHPDTVCDAVAEAISRRLCALYLARHGRILHHNVDKVLLRGGRAEATFGGGNLVDPVEIYVAGRATGDLTELRAIVEETTREVIAIHIPGLSPLALRVVSLLRPGSADLVDVFERAGARRANDTSCGVGWAPLSALERAVLAVERGLTGEPWRRPRPWMGTDVKVMGVADADGVELTVAVAMVSGGLADLRAYEAACEEVQEEARRRAGIETGRAVRVAVNVGDDRPRGSVYLTVSGSSAESGDDGEVGRGNRANGLICPMRPSTMEAAAGKNPATHVGKLYHLLAERIAAGVVAEVPGVAEAHCWLVSRIGAPVDDPWVCDVALRAPGDAATLRVPVEAIARARLGAVEALTADLVAGRVSVW